MKYNTDTQLNLNLSQQSEITSNLQVKQFSVADAELILYSGYFSDAESDVIFQKLLTEVNWRQDQIKFYGQEINIPRLTAWYGDSGKSYTYSNITMNPIAWTPVLLTIKQRIEEVEKISFNSVLINLYRDGKDSVAWHSDDEPELGKDPIIASVSFGGVRKFQLRHRFDKTLEKVEFNLTH
ncbi:alpha-ketoglutarate-dependent dioxygenase AlkB, partial [Dolichospermum sp. ST_sed5]|nr:alpha-ketoglutarate-dependent dioxygenase AlkB [Dolichospermum sp. ST_sed5]